VAPDAKLSVVDDDRFGFSLSFYLFACCVGGIVGRIRPGPADAVDGPRVDSGTDFLLGINES
jgi:hypothetical protein